MTHVEWPGLTRTLASFVAKQEVDIPEAVRVETQRLVLDTLGCILGGWAMTRGRLAAGLAQDLAGAPQATILGTSTRVGVDHAAFANAELANSLDADAAFLNISHIVPSIVPGVLAAAEALGCGGARTLEAIAVGHELAARLTMAITPVLEGSDGIQTRHVIGPVLGYGFAALGVAAGVGRLLDLDAERMTHGLGLAAYYSPVPSVLAWLRASPFSMVKYAPTGWTAQAGLTAALLAAKGYTADTSVVDSRQSVMQLWGSQRYEPEYLLDGLGHDWQSVRWLTYKPQPVCNLYRPHLWLLDRLRREEGLHPDTIDRIALRMHAPAGADRPYTSGLPETQEAVHMSAPYTVALVLRGIPAGPRWVDLTLAEDAALRRYMQKVTVQGNPSTAEITYRPWTGPEFADLLKRAPGEIEVEAGGKRYHRRTDYTYGDMWGPPSMRFTDKDLVTKFAEMTRTTLSDGRRADVIDLVRRDFHRLTTLEPVISLATMDAGH